MKCAAPRRRWLVSHDRCARRHHMSGDVGAAPTRRSGVTVAGLVSAHEGPRLSRRSIPSAVVVLAEG
jgi:hypothetical protein